MMKTILRIFMTLLLAVSSSAAYAGAPGGKVGVRFDTTRQDFGIVAESAGSVRMEYTMYNDSDKAVAILSARASCGCTEPSYDRRPIMPGDSTVIHVAFSTTGQRGEISKEVTLRLRSASGKSEKVQLSFCGNIVPPQP